MDNFAGEMMDYQARHARARKLQLAIVAGEFLIASVAGVIVGLIERSVGWGLIAALTVGVGCVLVGSLLFWWLWRARHHE